MEYASNAKANTGVTLGAIGTGLGILNGGLGLLGANPAMYGGYGGNAMMTAAAIASDDRHVNHWEMETLERLMASERNNAILAADNETNKKLVDVYAKLESRDKEIWNRIEELRRHQEDINREQAVYNSVNTATVKCIRHDVDELMKMTKLGIRNDVIWPEEDATT